MQETGSNLGTSIDTTVVEVKEEYLYLLGIIFSKCVHQKKSGYIFDLQKLLNSYNYYCNS